MRWTDEQVDAWIAWLLRTGVLLAAGMVLAATLWQFATGTRETPGYHVFRGEPAELRTVSGILAGTARFDPQSWIQLGLLLLMATPVARVAFSVVAFAAQRDWTYVAITMAVLGILVYSLAGGG